MNKNWLKYTMVFGGALLLALPAVGFAQLDGSPHGARWDDRGLEGELLAGGEGPAAQRGDGRFAPGRERGGNDGNQGLRRGRGTGRRGNAVGNVGRRGASLAVRALAQSEDIGLSGDQRDQILAAQRVSQEASINRRAATQIAQLELRDLMRADATDIAAVEAKLREVSEFGIDGQVAALRLNEAVTEVLSAEQIEALDDAPRGRGRGQQGRGGSPNRRIAR